MDERAGRIGERVRAFIRDPAADDFDVLALEVFRYQHETNPAYRSLCEGRGIAPETVTDWMRIPPVPADAFAQLALTCASPAILFRTSGTTRGGSERGIHGVVDASLYELSVTETFRHFLLPDRERLRILSLIPTLDEQPDSSLSYMTDVVLARFGGPGSGTYVRDRRALLGAFFAALARASSEGEPVLLMGTTLAFIPVLEAASEAGIRCMLPPRSRLMDTGGTKGLGREFDEERLVSRYRDVFGLHPGACVNEYGMTELFSQMYNDDLRALARHDWSSDALTTPVRRRVKHGPHWMRSRVVDPETLADADAGIVCHYDLANCHSVMAVLTDDVGERRGDAFRLTGRRPGAAARGCSISMDEWLQ